MTVGIWILHHQRDGISNPFQKSHCHLCTGEIWPAFPGWDAEVRYARRHESGATQFGTSVFNEASCPKTSTNAYDAPGRSPRAITTQFDSAGKARWFWSC